MDCYNLTAKINIGNRLHHINKLINIVALVYKFPPYKSCVICHQKKAGQAVKPAPLWVIRLMSSTWARLNLIYWDESQLARFDLYSFLQIL
jgi:hypothetical protein